MTQQMNITNKKLIKELLEMINLKKIDEGTYEGVSRDFVGKRIFGGQVLAQALMAASHTADRPAHSLHAYFLNSGDVSQPVRYRVERLKDGRSLQSRQVTATQADTVIFTAMISFATQETGLTYQKDIPSYKEAETLPNETEVKKQFEKFIPKKYQHEVMREHHIEIRPIKMRNFIAPPKEEPKQAIWLRAHDVHQLIPSTVDYKTHQALFAFMSDYYLLGTSLYPHGVSFISHANLQAATIDHSIHFHHEIDVTQWLLHDMNCDVTSHTRGLSHGKIWQGDRLIASTQQEGLIRLRSIKDA